MYIERFAWSLYFDKHSVGASYPKRKIDSIPSYGVLGYDLIDSKRVPFE